MTKTGIKNGYIGMKMVYLQDKHFAQPIHYDRIILLNDATEEWKETFNKEIVRGFDHI